MISISNISFFIIEDTYIYIKKTELVYDILENKIYDHTMIIIIVDWLPSKINYLHGFVVVTIFKTIKRKICKNFNTTIWTIFLSMLLLTFFSKLNKNITAIHIYGNSNVLVWLPGSLNVQSYAQLFIYLRNWIP